MPFNDLAIKRGGDVEACELAALFHDMAMVANFGSREEHEQYGAKMAVSTLTELDYPKDKKVDKRLSKIKSKSQKRASR